MDSNQNTATLLGGVELTVTLLNGGQETVKVRQLTIKQYPELLSVLEDEMAQAELYCEKPKGWAETLSTVSFDLLISKADEVNADFFARWLQRRMSRQEKIMPGFVQGLKDKFLTSLNSAPKSPPSPVTLGRRS